MAILSIAMLVFAVISLFEVYTFLNWSIGQAKIMIPTSIISCLIATALATMHYKVDKTHLRIKILGFDLLSGRIRIENILNIVYKEGKMYLSYLWQGNDPVIANVMIAPKNFDKLKEFLLSKNKNIIFFEEEDEISNSQQ